MKPISVSYFKVCLPKIYLIYNSLGKFYQFYHPLTLKKDEKAI